MLTLGQFLPFAETVLGTCDRDRLLYRINAAVNALANKGDFDPLYAVMDVAASGTSVPLPVEVETVLSVNIMGVPARGLDRLFNFHLDGPGDRRVNTQLRWWWKDEGQYPVFTNPTTGSCRLYATATLGTDVGTVLTIYGVDVNGDPLGHVDSGVFVPGLSITVQAAGGTPVVDSSLPFVNRIDRVTKPDTGGPVFLYTQDLTLSGNTDMLIAAYRKNWSEPLFRIITLERPADWVRIFFRRRVEPIVRDTDLVPLHSPLAVEMMLRALKCYDESQVKDGLAFEALALKFLSEEARRRRANLWMPPQMDINSSLMPGYDQIT